MSVTLDIPDQLAELLRALAHERGVSIEELSQQAFAVGLTTLAVGAASDIVNIEPAHENRLIPGTVVSMRSPIITTGQVRLRTITIEPSAEASGDAH
jgi:hypothetical protein